MHCACGDDDDLGTIEAERCRARAQEKEHTRDNRYGLGIADMLTCRDARVQDGGRNCILYFIVDAIALGWWTLVVREFCDAGGSSGHRTQGDLLRLAWTCFAWLGVPSLVIVTYIYI